MPWLTPTLKQVRESVRSDIIASLSGASFVGNSVLRVVSDAMAGLCHLTLRYIDWLARQFLPDTAEKEWLDRHGQIWLGGRKVASISTGGQATISGTPNFVLPKWSQFYNIINKQEYSFETLEDVTIDENGIGLLTMRAVTAGSGGNLVPGDFLHMREGVPGINLDASVTAPFTGGTDTETDEQLRVRVLKRIRQPPMGGATHDYEQWALAVPGCTRAWCAPLEMGIGTVTVRVLFDDLRDDDFGWPRAEDLAAVTTYIDQKRPVAVKDFWVYAPIKRFIDVHIAQLQPDTPDIRANIQAALLEMLYDKAKPGQTIFATWKAQAIMNALGVISCDLTVWDDDPMPTNGHMAILGDILYEF
jgi:uncharacterized phage protein gp47/JayE